MGGVPVDVWIDWDDAIGVNRIMAIVVVADDMIHIHRLGDALILVELAGIGPKIRIIYDALAVAFEMQVINAVKTQEGWKQAPIDLGEPVAHDIALARQAVL